MPSIGDDDDYPVGRDVDVEGRLGGKERGMSLPECTVLRGCVVFLGCIFLRTCVQKIVAKKAKKQRANSPQQRTHDDWAVTRGTALPEIWVFVAMHSGVVGAWRLTGVCKASREGSQRWLRTLPGMVVCGGCTPDVGGRTVSYTSDVWRLDLSKLRWERMPSLGCIRTSHACCAVRAGVVVLGGYVGDGEDRNEILEHNSVDEEEKIFKVLPPLSARGVLLRGQLTIALAIDEYQSEQGQVIIIREGNGEAVSSSVVAIDESQSEQGQVVMIREGGGEAASSSAVHNVDLATGVCTPLPPLLYHHGHLSGRSAARLGDGRIVCVGANFSDEPPRSRIRLRRNAPSWSAQVLEPSEHGSPSEAGWQWKYLPGMHSRGRSSASACVLGDGRFAVFGGDIHSGATTTSSCEALTFDGELARWDPLPPMQEPRSCFACAAIGSCVIVTGGSWWAPGSESVEVYEEALGQWRRLPCDLPWAGGLRFMGSAVM